MRVGVYAGANHPIAPALAAGFTSQGAGAFVRASDYYRDEIEPFDLVVVYGARSGARVRTAYTAAGIPAVTCDWGYMARVNTREEHERGHFQVGLGGLNSVPTFDCPPDRFKALGIDIAARGGDPNGYVLLVGQVPGDAAHGMDIDSHKRWLRKVAAKYPHVRYRPHPQEPVDVPGLQRAEGDLAQAISGARLVVTWNSNTGHDALLAGVPVVAHGPAAYAELAGEALPPLDARRAYFNRAAYGQWTLAEMRSGQAAAFILNHLVPGVSPLAPAKKRRRRRGA